MYLRDTVSMQQVGASLGVAASTVMRAIWGEGLYRHLRPDDETFAALRLAADSRRVGGRPSLTEEKVASIRAAVEQEAALPGWFVLVGRRLAEEVGCSDATVNNYLKKFRNGRKR